jgi:hypothetical protein
MKSTSYHHPKPRLRMSGVVHPPPLYAFWEQTRETLLFIASVSKMVPMKPIWWAVHHSQHIQKGKKNGVISKCYIKYKNLVNIILLSWILWFSCHSDSPWTGSEQERLNSDGQFTIHILVFCFMVLHMEVQYIHASCDGANVTVGLKYASAYVKCYVAKKAFH